MLSIAQQTWLRPEMLNAVMWMVFFFVVMYIIMIRPQRLKEKKRQEMLSKLKKNDRVVTIGGIFGTVVNIRDKDVVLRVDDGNNVKLRILRSAVARVVEKDEDAGSE